MFDLICIGGGSGGIATANRAARFGATCAVIEADKLGGTCVNRGCVPKKIMWFASDIANTLQHAADYGFAPVDSKLDWPTLIKKREAYITRLNKLYKQTLINNSITIINGVAQFIDPHHISVDEQVYYAKHIVIATGGKPMIPDIPGAELGITSDGFFKLTEQPDNIAIVGAGYIAVELACMLQQLGSNVTLCVRYDKPLRKFDTMLSDSLITAMQRHGIQIKTHFTPTALSQINNKLTLYAEQHNQLDNLDCVIWAIGRSPNTQQLQLNNAGVQCDNKGYIPADLYQTTNVPHIYSLGDIYGKVELTPVAIAAGRRLAHRLFNQEKKLKLDYDLVPTVIFSHPPIATIGLTEAQAIAQYGKNNIHMYTTMFKPMYFAFSDTPEFSVIKLITQGDQETIIGCHLFGTGMDEILQGVAIAIKMGATKHDFDNTIAIHPTSAEELVTIG